VTALRAQLDGHRCQRQFRRLQWRRRRVKDALVSVNVGAAGLAAAAAVAAAAAATAAGGP